MSFKILRVTDEIHGETLRLIFLDGTVAQGCRLHKADMITASEESC